MCLRHRPAPKRPLARQSFFKRDAHCDRTARAFEWQHAVPCSERRDGKRHKRNKQVRHDETGRIDRPGNKVLFFICRGSQRCQRDRCARKPAASLGHGRPQATNPWWEQTPVLSTHRQICDVAVVKESLSYMKSNDASRCAVPARRHLVATCNQGSQLIARRFRGQPSRAYH